MSKTDELKATFFQEAEDLLEGLADGLDELSEGDADSETVNAIFRAVHSIKGGAGAFGLETVVRFAHRFENVLDSMRNGELSVDAPVLDVLMRAADHLTVLVEAARDEAATDDTVCDGLIEELCSLNGSSDTPQDGMAEVAFTPMVLDLDDFGPPPDATPRYRVRFLPSDGLYASGNETGFLLRDLCDLGEATVQCHDDELPPLADLDPSANYLAWDIELESEASETAVREVFDFVEGLCELAVEAVAHTSEGVAPIALPEVIEEGPAPDRAAPASAAPEPKSATTAAAAQEKQAPTKKQAEGRSQPVASTIRVELDRIDRMINLVGELVINQAMLSQCVKRAEIPQGGDIDVGLDELRTLTRQIQDSVMAIRAQPVKSLFQRMSRIAREAGTEVGKTLRVETEGAATEIDKTVIEKLSDPLTHMIRNAVDHGLEDADKRTAAGKAPTGTISLSAAHLSGRVVIEISDDGAGIDRERVRAIAEEKGLVSPETQLSPNEVDNLIFLPGFSTAKELSNLSGRGVGMDVVKRSIQSLGGRVSISSEAGKGSVFSIVLPLTLAVLDGMVIEVGGQTVVVPISAIVETMRLSAAEVFKLGTQNSVVRIRGNYVPIVDVGSILGYRASVTEPDSCVFLLVETADGDRAALLIDEIHDQRQVVIKGLEENYGQVPGVAAATILGDGRIALILDPFAIVGAAANANGFMSTQATLAAE